MRRGCGGVWAKRRTLRILTAGILVFLLATVFVGCQKKESGRRVGDLGSAMAAASKVPSVVNTGEVQPKPPMKAAPGTPASPAVRLTPAVAGALEPPEAGTQPIPPEENNPPQVEMKPFVIAETPMSGESKPLIELPTGPSPLRIRPSPHCDDESLFERFKAANPNPNPAALPQQFAEGAPPSDLWTGNPELDAINHPGDPRLEAAPVAQGVAWQDSDAAATGQPPDTDLAVSDSYVVTDYNSAIYVHDKTGTLVAGPTTIQSIFNSAGMSTCGATETASSWLSDPQVLWDEASSRWFLSMLRITGGGTGTYLCLACSTGTSPTGTWRGWEANMGSTTIADYPHLGVGEDAAFLGTNDFSGSSGSYLGSVVRAVYPKSTLLAGGTVTWYSSGYMAQNAYTPQPVELHGYPGQWPPASSPHYVLAVEGATTGVGQIWRWTYPTNTGSLTYVSSPGFNYTNGDVYPSYNVYASTQIDDLGLRWMDADERYPSIFMARTLGSASDSTCHGDGSANQPCDIIQWGQYNVSTASIVQQGNYGVTGNHLWCPDVAVDKDFDFAVGYTYVKDTGSTGPTYVSAYISGRNSTDTAGTLSSPVQSYNGTTINNTYTQSGRDRWGDYLGLQIDPNGCDLWFNGMYSGTSAGGYTDHMYVQKFKFASCTPGATRVATLNKASYLCLDTVSGSITDTGGTPTQAVYHSTHGTVSATISGGPNNYTVSPTTITALNAVEGDNIWLTFRGSDSTNHSSANSTVDCSFTVCLYKVDELSGGCDDDMYHDVGETLTYNAAIANLETSDLPTGFTATLSTTSPDVTIVNPTMTFGALTANTYAYSPAPFAVTYSGTGCGPTTLNYSVAINSLDGSWYGSATQCNAVPADEGGPFPNTFTETANLNWPTVVKERFNNVTPFPPTGWTVSGTGCVWRSTAFNSRDNGTGGTGEAADADSDICGPYLSMSSNLTTPYFDTTGYTSGTLRFKDLATDYSSGGGASVYYTSNSGSSWTTLGLTYTACNTTTAGICCDMITPNPQQRSVSMPAGMFAGTGRGFQWRYAPSKAYQCFWEIDDVMVHMGSTVCQNTPSCTKAPVLTYGNSWEVDDANCNNTTWLDPGEGDDAHPVDLVIYLDNTGTDWAYGTTATLSCPTCDSVFGAGKVKICKTTATYGNIPYNTDYVYGAGTADTFRVAIDPTIACTAAGTTIPFVVTANATNPYGPVTISAPVKLGMPTTDAAVTYADAFSTAPTTGGAGGRTGFNTAWTASSGTWTSVTNTSTCTTTDTGMTSCQRNPSVDRYIQHTFNTSGMTSDIQVRVNWNRSNARTGDRIYLDVSPNGSTWYRVAQSSGSGTTTASWSCLSGSIYATVYGKYGQAAADSLLNNANFAVRLGNATSAQSGTTQTWNFDLFRLTGAHWVCSSTTCTGTCTVAAHPKPVPLDNVVTGTPFTLTKTATNTANYAWDGTSCSSPNYMVAWGNITSLSLVGGVTNGTVTQGNCALTGSSATGVTTPTVSSGQCLFAVITGVNGANFGRWGNNTNGNEELLSGDTGICTGVTTKDTTATSCAKAAEGDEACAPARIPTRIPKGSRLGQPVTHCCGETSEGESHPIPGRRSGR